MPNSALNNRPLHCSNLSNNFPSINLLPTNFSVILIITESILTRRWSRGRRVSDCCSWDGVECDNNTSQVIGLDLSCSWLNGTIHPNTTIFYYFPHLQSLNLAFNDFGEIPEIIGRLNSIRGLNLSHNNLIGYIPASLAN
ncbi:receptor-like protein 35 isoform X4 [Camellia sinensis]|uniref:receptor-like protein 35 isoform X4 n=1 Tax=Camellia sinensis TaxID=4442 RepID=UPI001035D99D|nr:receptor-like protein 35 isoform X4 [Camellia sinensis]